MQDSLHGTMIAQTIHLYGLPMLPFVELGHAPHADACIIWLHGLGADGHDFVPAIEWMAPEPNWRFILPHAPRRPVTINHGMQMPAWYDIYGSDIAARQDAAGIRQSAAGVDALIEAQRARGIATERILLAGFSQGGAIALHCGLRYAGRLGGIIALSTYLPLAQDLDTEKSAANAATPVFMAHGLYDAVIPADVGLASCARLRQSGYEVDWHSYRMQHSVCEEELSDTRQFIAARLA